MAVGSDLLASGPLVELGAYWWNGVPRYGTFDIQRHSTIDFVYLLKNYFFKKINFKKINYFLIFDSVMKNKLENTLVMSWKIS